MFGAVDGFIVVGSDGDQQLEQGIRKRGRGRALTRIARDGGLCAHSDRPPGQLQTGHWSKPLLGRTASCRRGCWAYRASVVDFRVARSLRLRGVAANPESEASTGPAQRMPSGSCEATRDRPPGAAGSCATIAAGADWIDLTAGQDLSQPAHGTTGTVIDPVADAVVTPMIGVIRGGVPRPTLCLARANRRTLRQPETLARRLQNRWRGARRRAVGSTPMRSRHRRWPGLR